MEQLITGMPKFKSAEEELAFLREHVAKREYSLRQEGIPQKGEDITADVLEEYREAEVEEVLHPDMTLPELKQEQIVLRLKPEDHDKNIEELLGILMEHGIKNALAVLDKMNNPHLDDDFHRFLVQFMHSGQVLADLKKETPLWKTLHMT